LVEETGVPEENHWLVASHGQTLSHNVVSTTPEWDSNSQLQWIVYQEGQGDMPSLETES
jgi:hypothetical protein